MKRIKDKAILAGFLGLSVCTSDVDSDDVQYEERTNSIPTIECGKELSDMLDDTIDGFLDEPLKPLEVKPSSFKIVALSNLAEGIRNIYESCPNIDDKEFEEAIEKIAMAAISSKNSPYRTSPNRVRNLGNHGLYLAHLNVILGHYEAIVGDDRFYELNRRISRHLASKLVTSSRKHVRSYPKKPYMWPADQTVVLYSLRLFDNNNGTNISDKPIKSWMDYMERKATTKEGLPFSEVTGVSYGKTPRGCALSWSVRYMARFAPEEAEEIWENYKKLYFENYIVAGGFREWPRGVNGKADVDSGPIVEGIGVAATAFGIGAARAVGDGDVYKKLKRAESGGNIILGASKDLRKVASGILPSAISLASDTTPNLYVDDI